MDHNKHQTLSTRRSLKRKLEQDFQEDKADCKFPILSSNDDIDKDLVKDIRTHVDVLKSAFSSADADRAAARHAAQSLAELAKNGAVVCLFVPIMFLMLMYNLFYLLHAIL